MIFSKKKFYLYNLFVFVVIKINIVKSIFIV